MRAYKRWQDWIEVAAGVCLIAAPYVFGETSNSTALWATAIIGAAMAVFGLVAASTRYANAAEFLPALAGVVAFAAPWVFTYSNLTATSWASWIAGVVVVLAAGEVSLESSATAHA